MIKMLGLSMARHWHDLMVQHHGYLCRDCIILGGGGSEMGVCVH